jgi:hypothetical protein
MTSRQSFALSAVVADVHDLERLKAFAKTVVNDADRFGTILTVDRFEGRLTWHVSVTALSDQFKPMSWEVLKPSQREAVRQLARELLDDVGRPNSDFEVAEDKSCQIIRKLTIEEERLIRRQKRTHFFLFCWLRPSLAYCGQVAFAS